MLEHPTANAAQPATKSHLKDPVFMVHLPRVPEVRDPSRKSFTLS